MKRIYFCIPLAILLVTSMSILSCAGENATITGDSFRLRAAPSTNAEIIQSINRGERVQALAHTDFTDSIDGFTGYWYLISYNDQRGYGFGKYIDIDIGAPIPSESEIPAPPPPKDPGGPANLEDILGNWPSYYDAPNVIFSFYPDGKAKFVESTLVGESGERLVIYPEVWGTYAFDGRVISARWDDGTVSTFYVNKYRGVTTIIVNGELLPPELHMLAPGESLKND